MIDGQLKENKDTGSVTSIKGDFENRAAMPAPPAGESGLKKFGRTVGSIGDLPGNIAESVSGVIPAVGDALGEFGEGFAERFSGDNKGSNFGAPYLP